MHLRIKAGLAHSFMATGALFTARDLWPYQPPMYSRSRQYHLAAALWHNLVALTIWGCGGK